MPRRGHAKSSARPAGTGIASPLTSTFVATASVILERAFPPSSSSDSLETSEVNGTAGPASGLAFAPAFPVAAPAETSGTASTAAFVSSTGKATEAARAVSQRSI